MALSEIIQNGLNNPDCAYFTGMFMGELFFLKAIFYYFIIKGSYEIVSNAIKKYFETSKSKKRKLKLFKHWKFRK